MSLLLQFWVDLPKGLPKGLKIPGVDDYAKPDGATSPPYFEWLERNTHIIYPALAVVVVVLIVGGILQSWRTTDIAGVAKAEAKREIVLQLRREVHGMSVERLARMTGLDMMKLVKLLEEMQREGVVTSHTNTQRLTTWVLKGLRPS